PAEVVALHDTGEALALARADDVDLGPGLEDLDRELLADRVLGGVGRADLRDMTARRDAGLLEVAGERLGDLAGIDLTGGELHGAIAVHLRGAQLGHDVGGDLDDGHRNETVVLIPDLRHAEL